MTDINKLIEGLQLNIDCIGTSKITRQEALDNLNNTISFLSSLQPSGNEELIKALGDIRKDIIDGNYAIGVAALDEAMKILLAPKPFDVLEHIGNQEYVISKDGRLWRTNGCGGLMVSDVGSESSRYCNASEYMLFTKELLEQKLEPYTPPEPELEHGWYWVETHKKERRPYYLKQVITQDSERKLNAFVNPDDPQIVGVDLDMIGTVLGKLEAPEVVQ